MYLLHLSISNEIFHHHSKQCAIFLSLHRETTFLLNNNDHVRVSQICKFNESQDNALVNHSNSTCDQDINVLSGIRIWFTNETIKTLKIYKVTKAVNGFFIIGEKIHILFCLYCFNLLLKELIRSYVYAKFQSKA